MVTDSGVDRQCCGCYYAEWCGPLNIKKEMRGIVHNGCGFRMSYRDKIGLTVFIQKALDKVIAGQSENFTNHPMHNNLLNIYFFFLYFFTFVFQIVSGIRGDIKINWLQPQYSAASCSQLI